MYLYEAIEEVFPTIELYLGKEGTKAFSVCEYGRLHQYHFGLGLWIRNEVLADDREIYKLFVKNGMVHKDDMSGCIIKLFYIYCQKKQL